VFAAGRLPFLGDGSEQHSEPRIPRRFNISVQVVSSPFLTSGISLRRTLASNDSRDSTQSRNFTRGIRGNGNRAKGPLSPAIPATILGSYHQQGVNVPVAAPQRRLNKQTEKPRELWAGSSAWYTDESQAKERPVCKQTTRPRLRKAAGSNPARSTITT